MTYAFWMKCDFQVHTCRDPNWVGPRPIGMGEKMADGADVSAADVDAARLSWAKEFLTLCVAKGLRAVAITDHHETVMIPYLRQAFSEHNSANPAASVWLFPGMELTASGGKQCIVLFDSDITEEWLTQAQGKLGIVFADKDTKLSKGSKVEQLTTPYHGITPLLNELKPLQKRFIVLPNISQSGTHTVLGDGAHGEFRKMSCIGGYLDAGQTHDSYSTTNKTRMSGTDSTWTKRRVYPIQTSDSRSADRASLGTNDTWIKLEAPTAEAIRQAFLAHQSRIRTTPPQLASVFVSKVSVSGSNILNDFTLELSPEQNSFIGGRGTGKSSVLEYISFGLGRSCSDLAERDSYSGNQRLVELITDSIKSRNGRITLQVSQDGALFEVTRGPDTAYTPQITYPNGQKQSVSVKDLRSLFPAVVYSQGELAELGKMTAGKADLTDLLQFVNPEYKREDDAMLADLESARREVRQGVERLVESWQLLAAIRKLAATRDSLRDRIAALEKTLPALSPDDQKVVDLFEAASGFEEQREQVSKHVERMALDAQALQLAHGEPRDLGGLELEEATKLRDVYGSLHADFASSVISLKQTVEAKKAVFVDAEQGWAAKLKELRAARDQVLEKLSAHRVATAQIIKLKEEMTKVSSQIGDLETRAKTFGDVAARMTTGLESLRQNIQKRASRTQEWAKEIETLSSGKIIAKVLPEANISQIREAIESLAAKSGSQESHRVREVDAMISTHGAWGTIDRMRTDALALLHHRLLGGVAEGDPPAAPNLFGVLGGGDKTRAALIDLLDVSRLSAIATASPTPQIELSYSDGDRQIAFEKASEGQRAGALLFMLLEQAGGPLIIDQPEGDLDNSIIADLTDKLHLAKQRRQLTFASHNANIVVNGSSELVGHLRVDSAGGRIFDAIGAIDSRNVRDVITSTMEGGETAFRDRQEKYGF